MATQAPPDDNDLDFTSFFPARTVAPVTPAQKAKIEAEALIGENEIARGGFCVSMARPGVRPFKPIQGKAIPANSKVKATADSRLPHEAEAALPKTVREL